MPRSALIKYRSGRPSLDPGCLRHSIKLLQESTVAGEYDDAGPAREWQEFLQARAAIDTARGTDIAQDGQMTAQRFLYVVMWYRAGVLPNMRVQMAATDAIYVIQAVENVLQMNVLMELTCVALGANL